MDPNNNRKSTYGEYDSGFWISAVFNTALLLLVLVALIACILSAYNSHWGHLVAWFIAGFAAIFVFRRIDMPMTKTQRAAKQFRDTYRASMGRN